MDRDYARRKQRSWRNTGMSAGVGDFRLSGKKKWFGARRQTACDVRKVVGGVVTNAVRYVTTERVSNEQVRTLRKMNESLGPVRGDLYYENKFLGDRDG